MIVSAAAQRGNPPLCPHALPPRLDHLRSTLRPGDPLLAGQAVNRPKKRGDGYFIHVEKA